MKITVVIKTIFYLAYFFVFAGFLFHRSSNPTLGPYSIEHIALLIILALGFLIPQGLRYLSSRFGSKNVMLSVIPALGMLIIIYAICSMIYYNTRLHPFDPFLQMPPPKVNSAKFEKSENTIRILTLGGSTTQNGGLPYKQKYPTVLLKILREEYPDKNIELFNAGMMWYTTKHSLINYTTNMREWKPDIAIIMHGVNDIMRSCEDENFTVGKYNRHWSHFYGPSINGAKPITFEKWILSPFTNIWLSAVKKNEVELPVEKFKSRAEYERNLGTLIQYLKADGVLPVVMTQPFLYKGTMNKEERMALTFGNSYCKENIGFLKYTYPSATSLRTAMEAFNISAVQIAQSKNVVIVDSEKALPRNMEYFRDDVHYTKEGAALLAQTVADKIITERLIEENPK
ncbi:MAG: hypothetical protein DHS20C13_03550 [Thermodesulfobacteriota bacterium]|nr:MAG: hypothetical protein DHS20C13_03550 [Thermodesulfobacteriota bacterium]